MRILIVSNYVSHHQLPFARALANLVDGSNLRFAAVSEPDQERLLLGWNDDDDESWILRSWKSEFEKVTFLRWFESADIVLSGERMFSSFSARVESRKHCVYMSERWWKPAIGRMRILHPRIACSVASFKRLAKSEHFNYFAIGPNAARDLLPYCEAHKPVWRWGYFADKVSPVFDATPYKGVLRVLWIGRFLSLKRVGDLIRAVADAQTQGTNVTLTLVGNGSARPALVRLAYEILSPGTFTFNEPVSAREVGRFFRDADVYVLPSSGREGWGMVVNEAMTYSIPVIVTRQSGAGGTLIEHGKTGLLFDAGDWRRLAQYLILLAKDSRLRVGLGRAGNKTIDDLWSPRVAAERFLGFSISALDRKRFIEYQDGPISNWRGRI